MLIKEVNIIVKRVIFESDTNDFKIILAEVLDEHHELPYEISIKGEMSTITEGDLMKVSIAQDLKTHYENSYDLKRVHYGLPEDAKEQWNYLERSGSVSETMFKRILALYNNSKDKKVLDEILEDKIDLTDIEGIGEARANLIKSKLSKNQDKGLLASAIGHIEGVGEALIDKLLEIGSNVKDTVDKIKSNPFWLLGLANVGFELADRIRQEYGQSPVSDDRIGYGINYVIENNIRRTGDTYIKRSEVIKKSHKLLGVNIQEIEERMNNAFLKDYKVIAFNEESKNEETLMSLSSVYESEKRMYYHINRLMDKDSLMFDEDIWRDAVKKVIKREDVDLSAQQEKFLYSVNKNSLTLLIGSGGVGKSWVIRMLSLILDELNHSHLLIAPTGRAAKVLSGYVGKRAQTIHSALGLQPIDSDPIISYNRNIDESEKITADLIIIDESSMCDVDITSILLEFIHDKARVIFIGDDAQLPSVGAGNVLYDLINTYKANTVKLTEPYRQAAESGVYRVSQSIRRKKLSKMLGNGVRDMTSGDDVFLLQHTSTKPLFERSINLYKYLIEVEGYKSDDILFLIPTNVGDYGAYEVNRRLQEYLNPHLESKSEMKFGSKNSKIGEVTIREGDKVMVNTNMPNIRIASDAYLDHDRSDAAPYEAVFNGEMGRVIGIDLLHKLLKVAIDDTIYIFTRSECIKTLTLGYASTIHKAQGSQEKISISVYPKESSYFVSANMIYTGITRSQEKSYLFFTEDGFKSSLERFVNMRRNTISTYLVNKNK